MGSPVVETTAGKVRGFSEGGVHAFLGIPYAAPTSGRNRFRPPQELDSWVGVREATAFGPYCPQVSHKVSFTQRIEITRIEQPHPSVPQREDCLNLNVWTAGLNDGGKRPVLVWFHGGAWAFGVPGGPFSPASSTNGDRLAATGDVVIVSVTHRVGILGFCAAEHLLGADYAGSANAGVLDLVAALAWVRDNIERFGGDPGNVTIFGHSGGASKVQAMMALPRAQGLFHRAGCFSGHILTCFGRAESEALTAEAMRRLDIAPSQARALLDLSVERIVGAHAEMMASAGGLMGGGLRGLGFAPVVDGVVYDEHPLDAIRAGVSADIPLLASTTREEFTIQLGGDPKFGAFTSADLQARVRVFLGERAPDVIAAYRAARPATAATELLGEIIGDHLIRLTQLAVVEAHQARARVPSYMMMFCWGSRGLGGQLKAFHGVELPFVFDTVDRDEKLGAGPQDRPLVDATRDAWLAFARSGNPNHPGLPAWPAYDLTERATMLFNGDCCVEADPLRFARAHNVPLARTP